MVPAGPPSQNLIVLFLFGWSLSVSVPQGARTGDSQWVCVGAKAWSGPIGRPVQGIQFPGFSFPPFLKHTWAQLRNGESTASCF